ncbi:DUF4384 domain-containing protein [Thermodesulfovibrio yellowstonii]|jgi:hypothetical protein|uniref:DUF4384 domain-containing protein n=2 Tax=Thermodesulfovibrio yellowstonii TaxID=28262 RepID=B5YI66_THEYD|nr:DUF4384 domain-containing protein [Thermodesulfovibrio yellowstonii]ACI20577.1 hypothetical protein THEYE_A1907 [Thermodesulfovibrio yellowstonii DSM 11347]
MKQFSFKNFLLLTSSLFLFAFVALFLMSFSYASEKSVWVEATGEAYMSEIDTPKEVIARAKADAQRKAIEQAVGVFLKSHTIVSNSQLAEDLIYASVRGKINKVEIIKEGWDEKDRNIYKVSLRAFVEPIYPEKEHGLSVKLSLSKADLKEGDEVKIFYQANKDCYVYIFSIAADGSVTLLLPNSIMKDNFIRGQEIYSFPSESIKLRAMLLPDFNGNVAEESIKIIATKKKENLISLGFQEGMFQVYDAKSTGMISDLIRRLNQLEPDEWTEATVVYRIKKK